MTPNGEISKRTSQEMSEWRGFTRICAMTRNGEILKGLHREQPNGGVSQDFGPCPLMKGF